MTLVTSMIASAVILAALVALLLSGLLFAWSMDEPRRRWPGFFPLVIMLWLIFTGYGYMIMQMSDN